MKNRISAVLGLVIVLALLGVVSSAGAGPAKEGELRVAGTVVSRISYQGRLTDASGAPLDGNYNLKFELWNALSGGTKLREQTISGVQVQNGLFTVQLDAGQADFNGQGLWLAITVNGQLLSPRQEILPVPYALGLRPGTAITAPIYDGAVLRVENTDANPAGGGYAISAINASGYTWRPAIYGENKGASAGVYGRSDGWHATVGWQNGSNADFAGVYGYNGGAGPGVKGEGSTGVYGETSVDGGQAVWGVGKGGHSEGVLGTAEGQYAPGVYGIASGTGGTAVGVWGQSEHSDGVMGWTGGADKSGVYGNSGAGYGVTGISTNKTGVQGLGPTGVYGESSADYGQAVSGKGKGGHTEGVLGTSDVNVGVYGISGGTSGNNFGVWGQTAGTYGLFTNENLYVGGNCVGCTIAFVGQNGDTKSLEVGDVVAISGIAAPLQGQNTPVLKVKRAGAAGSGVLGVVQARAEISTQQARTASGERQQSTASEVAGIAPGAAAPGEYLFVVVQGIVQVRVDASSGPVAVGDSLAPIAGAKAQKVAALDTAAPVLGHALEPLAEGTGLIWVLVLGQ